jgi:putative ABC transport system substrate-binding protein
MNKIVLPKSLLFISLCIILSLLLTACGGGAQAQENYTIGVVNYAPGLNPVFEGFKAGMAERGYVEGQNVTYIYHGTVEPNPLAIDREIESLLVQDVDLFLTMGNLPTSRAKQAVAGRDIPIVFAPVVNPVEAGLVASIRHPGGNVTGIQISSTAPKALEWLTKIAPQATQVYLFYHPEDEVSVTSIKPLPEVAQTLGIELVLKESHSLMEVTAVIETLPKDAAIFMIPTPSLPMDGILEAADKRGLAVGSNLEMGALVTYGTDSFAIGKQAAGLVDQVRQGTALGDLPVETAEVFLGINLKAAKAIGLDIPDDILRQANTVVR